MWRRIQKGASFHLLQYFTDIVLISFIGWGNRVPAEWTGQLYHIKLSRVPSERTDQLYHIKLSTAHYQQESKS